MTKIIVRSMALAAVLTFLNAVAVPSSSHANALGAAACIVWNAHYFIQHNYTSREAFDWCGY